MANERAALQGETVQERAPRRRRGSRSDPLSRLDLSLSQLDAATYGRALAETPPTAAQAGAALAGLRDIEAAVLRDAGATALDDARRVVVGYEPARRAKGRKIANVERALYAVAAMLDASRVDGERV